MSTQDAVAHGLKVTAGVVTSAAVVMVAVFAIFATLEMIDFNMKASASPQPSLSTPQSSAPCSSPQQ
jgi:uncharacterized membrane protein YdfJ with MMPL/SSD domain